jgi:hypothetical protein
MRSAGHLIETEILNKFEQLSNQTLIIKTYIPEGIPIEKVKWKSLSGNEYEFIIGEDGREGGLQEVFNLRDYPLNCVNEDLLLHFINHFPGQR